MLGVVRLNGRDSFRDGVSRKPDGDPRPSGARVDGMKEGSVRSTRPNIVPAGGNDLEPRIGGDRDWLKCFPTIRGALDLPIGGNTPECSGRGSHKFHHLARCRHLAHARLGRHLDGSPSSRARNSFCSSDLCTRIPPPYYNTLRCPAQC